MPYVLGIGKVKDFEKWKSDFSSEEGANLRKRVGQKSYQMFRSANDPDTFVLLIEWDNLENARKFVQSKEHEELTQRSGIYESKAYLLEQVEKATV